MEDQHETWQRRIRDLYEHVEELYAHVDITVVVFDRELIPVAADDAMRVARFGHQLADIARRVLETGEPRRDIALDRTGRERVHAFPLRVQGVVAGAACIIDDDGARRELFVRCAMAIFDGYRQNEVALLERERRALEEARRANQLRDQFLAVVAHELRAPMSSILLWEQVLRDPALEPQRRTAALDAIHESASGQSLLAADLLDVSRAINGKLHIEKARTPISRVLSMAIETARSHATARKLEVVSQLDPELGDVIGDSRRLRQIFDNLLANAINYTEHGRISVHARQSDDSIVIEVCDTGRGIGPELLPHLFEPFKQGDEVPTGGGLGLGLAIARELVELHGGTLSASSDGLGRGARFTVCLPRARVPASGTSDVVGSITGVRVLVVDDDPRLLEAVELLLRRAGAIVTSAESAAAAYLRLEQGDIDVVLSDLGLRGEDGYSLVQRIRATPGAMQAVPVIAVTARSDDESRQRALAAGFDRYLPKPIEMPRVISTIAQLVHP